MDILIADDFDEVDEPAPVILKRPLERVLDAYGLGSGELRIASIGEGHSNFTFLIGRDDLRVVLRRPPRPPYEPTAHDVLREARIVAGLAGSRVPVPRILLTCADVSVMGAPFYVMEYLEGEIITARTPAALDDPAGRRGIALRLVDTLAEIHAFDWRSADLRLRDTDDYLERQLIRFGKLLHETARRDLPLLERTLELLSANLPKSCPNTLVHGDFRLGNLMWAADAPPRVIATFDWEMAAIGDPLVDVGYLLSTWPEPGDASGALLSLAGAVGHGGYPGRAELARYYSERTGRSLEAINWYVALALWRVAVGLETFYQRMVDGTFTRDAFTEGLETGVPELARRAYATISAVS